MAGAVIVFVFWMEGPTGIEQPLEHREAAAAAVLVHSAPDIRCLLCFSVSPVRDTKVPQDIQRCGV